MVRLRGLNCNTEFDFRTIQFNDTDKGIIMSEHKETVEKVNMNDAESVRSAVRARYGAIATADARGADTPAIGAAVKSASSCCAPSTASCCGAPAKSNVGMNASAITGQAIDPTTVISITVDSYAVNLGYDASELESLPGGANMGLSCGNPVAIASLREGEVVLDLGSGGGFDVFLAGRRVGAAGRVIGVDMTPEMLAKARRNIAHYTQETGFANVEFRLGEIENLPVADASVDVVISNCVVNLSPDKPRVWNEIARVLKPYGRVSISDLATVRPLPEAIARDVNMLMGCIAGAVSIEDNVRMALEAGLVDVRIERKDAAVDAMFGSTINSDDPIAKLFREAASADGCAKPSDYITSITITAMKPYHK
jgi:SAM-dependent methyltransferase